MFTAPRLAFALAVTLVASVSTPTDAAACCAAPRPELPFLVTPAGSTIAPGAGFVVYLSSDHAGATISLANEATHAQVSTVTRELAPHVVLAQVAATTPPGAYQVRVTSQGASPIDVGALTIGPTNGGAQPAAPRGRVRLTDRPGSRGASFRSATLALEGAPTNVVAVMSWMDGSQPHGNAVWVSAGAELNVAAQGRCSMSPQDASVPAAGSTVRVAFLDLAGRLGPWSMLRAE